MRGVHGHIQFSVKDTHKNGEDEDGEDSDEEDLLRGNDKQGKSGAAGISSKQNLFATSNGHE